jgi:hypothetical protein
MKSRQRQRESAWAWGVTALAGVALVAGLSRRTGAADLPFVEDFDSRSTGVLHSQNQWEAHRQNDAQVQNSVAFDGDKAAMVATNATAWRDFGDTDATNVWIDFYARVPHPTNSTPPVIGENAVAAFYVAGDGSIRAMSNDTWITTGTVIPSNTWYRFTVNLDYGTSNWSIYAVDGTPNKLATPVVTNLKFQSTATNTYFHRFRIKN